MSRRIILAVLALAACNGVVSIPSGTTSGHGAAGSGGATASTNTATSASSSGTAGAGGAGPDLAQFCAGYATWYCGEAVSCGCGSTFAWPGSVADCTTLIAEACVRDVLAVLNGSGWACRPDRAAGRLASLQAGGNQGRVHEPHLPSVYARAGPGNGRP